MHIDKEGDNLGHYLRLVGHTAKRQAQITFCVAVNSGSSLRSVSTVCPVRIKFICANAQTDILKIICSHVAVWKHSTAQFGM
jgi:hypothetical protein